jgi:uncharacterized protein (TIGR04222 family)
VIPITLTGPEFLTIYIALLVVLVIAALMVRSGLRGPSDNQFPPSLDSYQAAFLAGGFQAAAEGAIVALTARGSLRVGDGGRFAAIEPRPGWLHPAEDAVWSAAASAGGSAKASTLVAAARPALLAVREQLRHLGLALTDGQAINVRTVPTLVVLAAAVLGGARLALGMAAGRPVGYLVALLVLTLIVALLFFRTPNPRTHRGDRLVRSLRRTNAALRTSAAAAAAGLAGADLALAVGLWGPSVLSGSPLDDVRQLLRPDTTSSGGSDSGSSCGGSSCGGGCGGGCGG